MGLSIVMPALGESVTEATVNRWLKQVGDRIEVGEPLVEVSTDKVDTEVASPAAGVIESLLVREDETVDIGTPIAVLADAGDAGAPDVAPVAETAEPDAPSPSPSPQPVPDPPVLATAPREPRTSGTFLSPLVRRLLDQYSIDPSTLVGSGANGRIRRDDVLAAAEATTATAAEARRSAAPRVTVAESTPSLSASSVSVAVVEVDVTSLEGRGETDAASRRGALIDAVATVVHDALERFPGLAARAGADPGADAAFPITDTGSRGTLWEIPTLPESSRAALSVGAVTRRAVVLTDAGEDRIAVRSMVYLALATDARAVDGDEAAQFLLDLKAGIEGEARA